MYFNSTPFLFVTILWAGTAFYTHAQDQTSEQNVELEQLFIDAGSAKLLGKTEEAAKIYSEILADYEENPVASYELARIRLEEQQINEALKLAESAVRKDPANLWYKKFLADLYELNGQYEKGAAVFDQIVQLQPNAPDLYYQWAFFELKAGNIRKAIKVYDELENKIGLTEEVIRRKHALYMGSGDFKRAEKELLRLTEAFPKNTEYLHLLAEFYVETGDENSAQKAYLAINALDPADPKAAMVLSGKTNGNTNDLEFLSNLKPLFKRPELPIDPKIQQILPLIQKASESEDSKLISALQSLTETLIEAHPQNTKAYAADADLYYLAGQNNRALEQYRIALKLDDTVYPVWEQYLRILFEQRQFDVLKSEAERAMDVFPNRARLYNFAGYAQYTLGALDDAQDFIFQAELISGGNMELKQEALSIKGLIYNAQDQSSESFTILREAWDINPQNPEVALRQAFIWIERDQQLETAESQLNDLEGVLGKQAEYLQARALLNYRKGNLETARNILEQTLELTSNYGPLLQELYGDVLFKLDAIPEALSAWENARNQGRITSLLTRKITNKQLYE